MTWILDERFARFGSIIYTVFVFCIIFAAPCGAQVLPWARQDIGSTGITSTFSYNSGVSPPTYTISGAGSGISGTDSFAFVSTPASGTGIDFQCRVVSQQNTGSGAQAGLIIRQSFGVNVGEVSIALTPGGINLYERSFNGGVTTVAGPLLSAPVYLKLSKSGTTITGSYSTDGVVWSSVGSFSSANLANLYQCGFNISSSVPGTLSQVVYDHVDLMTSVPQTGANLISWHRADDGITYSAGKISAWSDKSGVGNTASQGTGTNQPSLTTGAVNTGILPAATFDGTNSYMTMPSDFADFTAGAHFYSILSPSSSSATGDVFAIGNASNADALIGRDVALKPSMVVAKGAGSSTLTSPTTDLTQNQYQVFEGRFTPGPSANTGQGVLWVNSVQKATSSTLVQNMNNTTRANNSLGTEVSLANKFPGGIAELLLYNAPLNNTQQNSILSYLLSKYNLGATPTLDSPTFSPAGGAVLYPRQTVTISQGQGAVSYYTADGSTPSSTASLWYNNQPITVPASETLKAVSVMPFFTNSAIASAVYQVDPLTTAIPRNGLIAWYRGDAVSLSGSNVVSMTDLSGSGSDAVQNTAGNRPTQVTNALNGYPAVAFNGTNQFLQVPSTNLSNFTSGASCFLIVKPASVAANARFFDFGAGAAVDNLYFNQPASTSCALFAINNTTSSNVTATSSVTVGQFQLLEAVHNGAATATIFANSVQKQQSTVMQNLRNVSRPSDYIGQSATGTNFYNGQLAEMLIYNRGVTSTERSNIEAYLINRFQLLNSVTAPAPILSITTSTLTAPAQVAIAAPASASVYYTLDGTAPVAGSSPLYDRPLNIAWTQTLKAISLIKSVTSSVSTATYTLDSTKYPAPATSDTSTMQLNLQLPTVSIPQDSNQR